MQNVSFETTVKNGFIKIPTKYSGLNNTRVVVEIARKTHHEKSDNVKKMEEFIQMSRGC